jgi:hypothetical protein
VCVCIFLYYIVAAVDQGVIVRILVSMGSPRFPTLLPSGVASRDDGMKIVKFNIFADDEVSMSPMGYTLICSLHTVTIYRVWRGELTVSFIKM